MLDLQTLKFFCAVAQEGSVSKASQRLHYAQSNLSTKIIHLEQQLNTPLFLRTCHGVSLTHKGQLLYAYAQQLLQLADEATIAVSDDGSPTGNLLLGAMESAAITYLPKLLPSFYEQYPLVSVKVSTSPSERLVEMVLNHELDGGFVAGPITYKELQSVPLGREELVLVAPRAREQESLHRLLQQPLLVFPEGCSCKNSLRQWLLEEGLVPKQYYEFTTIGAVLASVSAGLGVAVFPESVVKVYGRQEALSVHHVPYANKTISHTFVYHGEGYHGTALKKFIKLLQAYTQ